MRIVPDVCVTLAFDKRRKTTQIGLFSNLEGVPAAVEYRGTMEISRGMQWCHCASDQDVNTAKKLLANVAVGLAAADRVLTVRGHRLHPDGDQGGERWPVTGSRQKLVGLGGSRSEKMSESRCQMTKATSMV